MFFDENEHHTLPGKFLLITTYNYIVHKFKILQYFCAGCYAKAALQKNKFNSYRTSVFTLHNMKLGIF